MAENTITQMIMFILYRVVYWTLFIKPGLHLENDGKRKVTKKNCLLTTTESENVFIRFRQIAWNVGSSKKTRTGPKQIMDERRTFV